MTGCSGYSDEMFDYLKFVIVFVLNFTFQKSILAGAPLFNAIYVDVLQCYLFKPDHVASATPTKRNKQEETKRSELINRTRNGNAPGCHPAFSPRLFNSSSEGLAFRNQSKGQLSGALTSRCNFPFSFTSPTAKASSKCSPCCSR